MLPKTNLFNARVLMICDDPQIDRRILHEAKTLINAGCEVIIISKLFQGGTPATVGGNSRRHDLVDGIKIEWIDMDEWSAKSSSRTAVTQILSLIFKQKSTEAVQTKAKIDPASIAANVKILGQLPFPDSGPLWLENWFRRRGFPIGREATKTLFWPPYRLELFARYFPSIGVVGRYALYLPTLILTPRPKALVWHWYRLRYRIHRFQENREEIVTGWIASLRRFWSQKAQIPVRLKSRCLAWVNGAAARLKSAQLSRKIKDKCLSLFTNKTRKVTGRDELLPWELAVMERGRFYRPDIIHAHDLPHLRPGYFLAQDLGVPLIYDAHELYPYVATWSRPEQKFYYALEEYFIRKADHCIGVNPFQVEIMAKDYGIPAPTVILNATVFPKGFEKGTRTDHLRKAIGLGPQDKVILIQGWSTIKRGTGNLIQAMALTPPHIHLALLAYGEVAQLQKLAAEWGVGSRVHFLTPVPSDELLWWVCSADAGIQPYPADDENIRICSPNKLFEFIAAAVPIIAIDLPYLRQVVAGEGFGIVHRMDSPQQIADAIKIMFAPDGKLLEQCRARLLAGQDPYLWSGQEETLLSIYRNILPQPHHMVQSISESDTLYLAAATG